MGIPADLLDKMTEVVKGCGERMLEADKHVIEASSKTSFKDLVTRFDVEIQKYAVSSFSQMFPGAGFICEETDDPGIKKDGMIFVIDPIDGTTNFVHHFMHSCTSIACVVDGSPVAGVVYNPFTDELFSAEAGKGAWLNNEKISVSDAPLKGSLVIYGTSPYNLDLAEATSRDVDMIYKRCQDVRRTGSAALDLCYVAAGRAGLFFEMVLSLWDYAAGAVILSEAGGVSMTYEGDPLVFDRPVKCSILAGRKEVIEESGLLR